MKNTELNIRNILNNLDFSSYVDYDSNREVAYDHDERCKDDYCRCSTLNPTINSFNYKDIVKLICEQFKIENEKTIYCIDRICSTLTIEDFYCNVCGGYYGEEMDSIVIENYDILNKLEENIDIKLARKKKISKINDSVKLDNNIRNILIMEYGYLLEDLKNASFSVIEIDPKHIILSQPDHAKNLNKNKVDGYKNHQGICGIVKEKNGIYKVIDGYHRITANLNKSKIKVILSNSKN